MHTIELRADEGACVYELAARHSRGLLAPVRQARRRMQQARHSAGGQAHMQCWMLIV